MKRIGLLFRVTVCGLFFLIALQGCSGGGGDGDGDTGDGGGPVGNPDAVTSSSALSTINVVQVGASVSITPESNLSFR